MNRYADPSLVLLYAKALTIELSPLTIAFSLSFFRDHHRIIKAPFEKLHRGKIARGIHDFFYII
jgi:hypothetical protein